MDPDSPQTPRQLRRVGLEVGLALIGLFGLLPPLFGYGWPRWPWFAGTPLVLIGLAWPLALSPVHRLWSRLGLALGWVNSRIILGVLFYGVLTPVGLFARLVRRDPLHRGYDPQAQSYREPAPPRDPKHMERPF